MSDPDWKALPSLSALRAFDATGRRLSFSDAARTLNVTPAAIAQQVRRLEADLGAPLVRRAGRGVALTEQGAQLARRLATGFESIAGGVTELREKLARRDLRVTTTPNIVDEFLMPRMGEFWMKHPDVEVSFLPCPEAIDLAQTGFDLGIRGGTGVFPELTSILLARTRWTIVASPALVGHGPVDLSRFPWTFVRNHELARTLVRRAGFDPDALHVLDMGAQPQQLKMAREGYCVAICTEFLVRRDIPAGRLRAFDFPAMPPTSYWAVTPRGPHRPAVDLFIRWLTSAFAEDVPPPLPVYEQVRV